MGPRPLVCLGLGWSAGLVWSQVVPAGGPMPLLLAALLALAAPGSWRWRAAAGFALLASLIATPVSPRAAGSLTSPLREEGRGGSYSADTLRFEGTVRGPVHATPTGQLVTLMGGARQVKVSIPHGNVRPCDRVWVQGRFRRGILRASEHRRHPAWCLSPWRLADDLHGRWRDRIGGGDRGRSLLRAMALGDRSGLDETDTRAFRRAGAAHVLAVSGLHLAVVAGLVFLGLKRGLALAVPAASVHRWAALGAALAAVAFTLVTGARISTVRALLMALVVLAIVASGRRPDARDALAMAVMVATAHSPALVADAGFQLSVAATAILVASTPGPLGRWRIPLLYLRASLSTALITAPIAAAHFGEVAWIGIVANPLIVPLVELGVVPLGFLGLLLSELWPPAGEVLVALASAIADHAAALCEVLAAAPTLHGLERAPPALACVLGAGAVARAGAREARALLVSALIAAGVALALAPSPRPPGPGLRVEVIAVGQGDGALVHFPGGAIWAVDVGPAVPGRVPAFVRALRRRGIRHLDRIVISHGHPDHDGALDEVLGAIDVAEVWRLAGDRTGPRLGAHRIGSAVVHVLAPVYVGEHAARDPVMEENDNSIVLLIDYGGRRILFTGDIELEAEDRVLRSYPRLGPVDVVKVPHHGSATSSTAALVRQLRPSWALISAGEGNHYGHPDREVVSRWRAVGARVLRTDRHGSITVTVHSDGAMSVKHRIWDP